MISHLSIGSHYLSGGGGSINKKGIFFLFWLLFVLHDDTSLFVHAFNKLNPLSQRIKFLPTSSFHHDVDLSTTKSCPSSRCRLASSFLASATLDSDTSSSSTTATTTMTPYIDIDMQSHRIGTETEWSQIETISVQTLDNQKMKIGDILSRLSTVQQHTSRLTVNGDTYHDNDSQATKTDTVVMSCLSHFGDYNAWELTQQYMAAIKSGRINDDCPIVLIGIGSVEAANTFASDIGLSTDPTFQDKIILVTDETGSVTEALDCYRGWLTVDKKHKERYPHTDINPAIKLLGMIFGFGSPGTIERVVQGYTGDTTKECGVFGRQWVIQALQQGSQKGRFPKVEVEVDSESHLRPFELATLRLQTGFHIVANWGKLGPEDGDLITRMGGTFVFSKKQCIYEQFDKGILNFCNIDDICMITEAAAKGKSYFPPSNKSLLKRNRQQFWERKDLEAKLRAENEAKQLEAARLKAEHLTREARLAEQARLEEFDRREAERIAEMARQGQEAKLARSMKEAKLAEENRLAQEARAVEDFRCEQAASITEQKTLLLPEVDSKPSIEIEIEIEGKSDKSIGDADSSTYVIDDDERVLNVTDVISQAEEIEKNLWTALEAIQIGRNKDSEIDLDPKTQNELFHRKLLSAKMKYETSARKPAPLTVKQSAEPPAQTDLTTSSKVRSSTSDISENQENDKFQQRLLAARIQYGKSRQTVAATTFRPSISVNTKDEAEETKITDAQRKERTELSHRNLLAARLKYEQEKRHECSTDNAFINDSSSLYSTHVNGSSNNDDEIFQRRLLAERLHYEKASHATKDADTQTNVREKMETPGVIPDQALL